MNYLKLGFHSISPAVCLGILLFVPSARSELWILLICLLLAPVLYILSSALLGLTEGVWQVVQYSGSVKLAYNRLRAK